MRSAFEDIKNAKTEELELTTANLLFGKSDKKDPLNEAMLIECKNELTHRVTHFMYNCGNCGKFFQADPKQKEIPTLYGDHFCSMDCYKAYFEKLVK